MNASKRKRSDGNRGGPRNGKSSFRGNSNNNGTQHRFGRVMSNPPKMASKRTNHPTVSIAIPGSVVSNAQTRELQTQLAGQIARAAAVFRVDEVVVYDDGLGSTLKTMSNYRRGNQRRGEGGDTGTKNTTDTTRKEEPSRQGRDTEKPAHLQASTDPHTFLARILQYCECKSEIVPFPRTSCTYAS